TQTAYLTFYGGHDDLIVRLLHHSALGVTPGISCRAAFVDAAAVGLCAAILSEVNCCRWSMSREQILSAIPHRPPMLLLDEIIEWEHERIVCKKTFQQAEWFFQGHYPDFPLVPGVLLCEAAMQAGAVLL